jgi:hypothetical protein
MNAKRAHLYASAIRFCDKVGGFTLAQWVFTCPQCSTELAHSQIYVRQIP